MSTRGTFEQAMGAVYDLYVQNRIADHVVLYYLENLLHPDGSLVFTKREADKLLATLKGDREELVLGTEDEEIIDYE